MTDDSGSLAITAWTCARCGGLIEEIRILSQDGKADRHRIRYAVRPQHALERFSANPFKFRTWRRKSRETEQRMCAGGNNDAT